MNPQPPLPNGQTDFQESLRIGSGNFLVQHPMAPESPNTSRKFSIFPFDSSLKSPLRGPSKDLLLTHPFDIFHFPSDDVERNSASSEMQIEDQLKFQDHEQDPVEPPKIETLPQPKETQKIFIEQHSIEIKEPEFVEEVEVVQSISESCSEEEEEEEVEEESPEPSELFIDKLNDHNYYSLAEDFFLFAKDLEYRSQKPRLQSKDEFLRCLAPILNRSIKSISKRIDRLRSLSPFQKQVFYGYIRRFPKGIHVRKIIFDNKGGKVLVKALNTRKLPKLEKEFLEKISEHLLSENPSIKFLLSIIQGHDPNAPINEGDETKKTDNFFAGSQVNSSSVLEQLEQQPFIVNREKAKWANSEASQAFGPEHSKDSDDLLSGKVEAFKSEFSNLERSDLAKNMTKSLVEFLCVCFRTDLSRLPDLIQADPETNFDHLKRRLMNDFVNKPSQRLDEEIFGKLR